METLILYPKTQEQLQALKAIAKAWNIKVETNSNDPKFVARAKKAEKFGDYCEIDSTATVHELSSSINASRLDSAISKFKQNRH